MEYVRKFSPALLVSFGNYGNICRYLTPGHVFLDQKNQVVFKPDFLFLFIPLLRQLPWNCLMVTG